MATWALPVPKLASTSGAYTPASRAPNSCRTAAVATSTSLPSGPDVAGPQHRAAGQRTPACCSTAHICGSQATMASEATCWTSHAAAAVRAAAAALSAAVLPAWPCAPEPPAAGDALALVRPPPRVSATPRAAAASSDGGQQHHGDHPPAWAGRPGRTVALPPQPDGGGQHRAPGRGGAGPGRLARRWPRGAAAWNRPAPAAWSGPGLAAPAGWSGGPSGRRAARAAGSGPAGSRPASRSARASVIASWAALMSCADRITASWAASSAKRRGPGGLGGWPGDPARSPPAGPVRDQLAHREPEGPTRPSQTAEHTSGRHFNRNSTM